MSWWYGPAAAAERDVILRTLRESWGSQVVVAHGVLIDASALPARVAVLDDRPVGLVTYTADRPDWQVVTLDAVVRGAGVGSALLDAVCAAAREAGAERVWLVTTNDNTGALRFYQRYGMDLVALHRDAVTEARRCKPEIPLTGDGIAIRHELELEVRLRPTGAGSTVTA